MYKSRKYCNEKTAIGTSGEPYDTQEEVEKKWSFYKGGAFTGFTVNRGSDCVCVCVIV